ncbi:hypothetical protein DFH09DRAFT_1083656 [Mycena vulgaris]|nr:hypothetical protein DFH09DRAFT_1083656 [Mycena vulgaris]
MQPSAIGSCRDGINREICVRMGHLARSYSDLGRTQDAADLEAIILEKRKHLLGDDHPETLLAAGNLASSYDDLGGTQDAAELQAMVLEKIKQVLGTNTQTPCLPWGILPAHTDAADLKGTILEKRKQLIGEDHPDTLLAMGNLASSYGDLGRTQDAADLKAVVLDLKSVVLEKRKQLLGEDKTIQKPCVP